MDGEVIRHFPGQIMYKPMVVAVSLFIVAASAFAEQPRRSNTVSVFVTDLALSNSNIGGATIDAAYGASFDHMFTERFSGELSVSSQRFRRYVRTFTGGSEPTSELFTDRLYPIDLNISYYFPNGSRWQPFLGAGLRYVNDTFHGYEGARRTAFYRNAVRTIDPEISGGITLQFNRTLGLRFDAKQVLGSRRSTVADPEFKASAGLSFRF
jgi:outer membrane protein W